MTIFSSTLRQLSRIFYYGRGLLFLCLCSCGQYQLNINERTVYDPREFVRTVQFADVSLEACVKRTLIEMNITAANQLRALQCGPGEISSLAGLEIFTRLQQFGATENKIVDLKPLERLPNLTQINLAGNLIKDASPLNKLAALTFVNIEGNERLDCDSVLALTQKPSVTLQLPTHCQKN